MRTISTAAYKCIQVSARSGGMLNVQLNRPSRFNSFNDGMFDELEQCFVRANQDAQVRVVLLTGNPESRHFTAGLDLQEQPIIGNQELAGKDTGRKAFWFRDLVKRWQRAFTAIEQCGKPVIAAVHGACIGAGVDLITACDIRYCTQDAYFSVKEVDLGLAADLGSLQRLVKIIGNQGQVSEWCLTGRPVDSQEAQRSGLVGRVFSGREELIKASEELAQLIASKSPVAVCGTKMALVHARDHSVTEGLDYIATWNCAMLQSDDVLTAVQAAISKQKPQFSNL